MSKRNKGYDGKKGKAAEPVSTGSAVSHSRVTKLRKKNPFKYTVHFRLVNFFIIALVIFTTGVMADLRFGGIFRGLTTDIQAEDISSGRIDNLRVHQAASFNLEEFSGELEPNPLIEAAIFEVEVEKDSTEPKVLTAVLYGHDEHGGGIDTTILVFANLDTMDIHLLSLPRDMELNFSAEARAEIVHAGYRPHTNSYGKLTNWGRSFDPALTRIVTRELSRVYDIPIDYYFAVDVEAFVKVIDLVGPIPFDVKQRMYYHNSIRLLVDLQPGFQYLDGRQAEGLVRFRNYKMGDFDRTSVQREFLEAVVGHIQDQGLSASDVFGLAQIALTHMQTNFVNPFPYFNLFGRLNDITIHSYMLPLELQGNSWRMSKKSFDFLDDILIQVYGIDAEVGDFEQGEISNELEGVVPVSFQDLLTGNSNGE